MARIPKHCPVCKSSRIMHHNTYIWCRACGWTEHNEQDEETPTRYDAKKFRR